MSWGFELGRTYNRRRDIHGRFGGQRQGGIITPRSEPLVIIITGDAGLAHGYHDRLRDDGVFEYFGEGQVGDMTMNRGNAAILNHSEHGKSLLMFSKAETDRRNLSFEGEWICQGYQTRRAPDREGIMRNAFVFELRRLEAVSEAVSAEPTNINRDLTAMKQRAMDAINPSPQRRQTFSTIFERSAAIRDYVVARANGRCEGCRQPAPFNRSNGVPYLEPHHIRRLSDGGPDDPHYVIALCPNCHRRVHFGADGEEYNQELLSRMETIEPRT